MKPTLKQFISGIQYEDVEGNSTYLYTKVNGCKYGQSYPNTVHTREDMTNRFAVFYYPFVQESTN